VSPEKFIIVGKLGRRRGVRGEINVTPATDFPERFLDLKEIYVETRGAWKRVKILSSTLVGGRPVLKLSGVNTPEEASKLTNLSLAVTSDQLVDLPDGTFYVFDLVGSAVIDLESEEKLGTIVDVQRYPANDVYLVEDEAGRELMVPAVAEFVKQIDIANKRVVILRAGLIDKTGS